MIIKLSEIASAMAAFFLRTDNPHEVTAEQVGSYSKEERGPEWLDTNKVPMGAVPFTRYGGLNWIPIGFSGSFEGATRNETDWNSASIFEDDGSAVTLVNATNGVRSSVYYSRVTFNADGSVQSYVPIATEYRPSFLAANEWIKAIRSSSGRTALWGDVKTDSTEYDSCVILTGNTANPQAHVGAFFLAPEEFSGMDRMVIANDTHVYAFIPQTNGVEISVFRVARVDIQTKRIVTWERITGITTVGIRNTFSNEDNVKFASVFAAFASGDDPVFIRGSSTVPTPVITRKSLWGDVDPSGVFHFRLMMGGQRNYGPSSAADAVGITWSFTPSTKRAETTPAIRGNTTITASGENNGILSFSGPNAYYGSKASPSLAQQPHDSVAISDRGYGIIIKFSNEGPGTLVTFMDNSPTNYWEFWDYTKHQVTAKTSRGYIRQYPGPVGDTTCNVTWLSKDTLGVVSSAAPNGGASGLVRQQCFAVTKATGGLTFDFDTDVYGLVKGFKPVPRENRANDYRYGHVEYHNADTGEMMVGGGRIDDVSMTSWRTFDDFTYSGEISVTSANWEAARTAALAAVKEFDANRWGAGFTNRMEIQVFGERPIPAILMIMTFDETTTRAFSTTFSVTTERRVGDIGKITLKRLINSTTYTSSRIINRTRWNMPPTTVYYSPTEKFTFVSMSQYVSAINGGGQPGMCVNLLHDDGASDYRDDWQKVASYNPWYFGYVHIGVIPGYGLGRYDMTANRAISGTGIFWSKIGKKKADIETWETEETRYMIVSQQAPIGWYVYVTEAVPVVMGGLRFSMLAATLDLTAVKANPANSTFYLYVVLTNDEPSYVLYTSPINDDPTHCYIGFVETDNVKVSRQVIYKVTRLGVWRLSGPQVGGAIPAIDGIPTSPATLDWVKK